MNVLLVEPYYAGSHAAWAEGLVSRTGCDVHVLALSGSHWKWRMHGGAITLARRFMESEFQPDLILATDMLDITTFLALTRERSAGVPVAAYFHENQLTYPWSPNDRDRQHNRDLHYAFINFVSALACDRIFFNSNFHRNSFLNALPDFLRDFPDHHEAATVAQLRDRSEVLPLALDLRSLDAVGPNARPDIRDYSRPWPLILWNHRWEYDKNPEEFFAALQVMIDRGHVFDIALLGEVFDVIPKPFLKASFEMGDRIIQSGYVPSRSAYAEWLWRADILPVTSAHDFFGASVMEAMYCECLPLLPRRLTYPELIPIELHQHSIYDSFEELVEMLDFAIRHTTEIRKERFREVAARNDWTVMAPHYEARFAAVAARAD